MFGLKVDEWRDLLLSVNVRRKKRRLSPAKAGSYILRALKHTSIESLAEAIGFNELSTLRKIAKIGELPEVASALVDWGTHRGSLSMSTAAELSRLKSPELVQDVFIEAVKHNFSRDEARQLVQIFLRSKKPIDVCVQSVLKTRPKIVRSQLVLGSILTCKAREKVAAVDSGVLKRKVELAMTRRFPEVTIQTLRFNENRFSLMLSDENANTLRIKLHGQSIESFLTELIELFSVK